MGHFPTTLPYGGFAAFGGSRTLDDAHYDHTRTTNRRAREKDLTRTRDNALLVCHEVMSDAYPRPKRGYMRYSMTSKRLGETQTGHRSPLSLTAERLVIKQHSRDHPYALHHVGDIEERHWRSCECQV